MDNPIEQPQDHIVDRNEMFYKPPYAGPIALDATPAFKFGPSDLQEFQTKWREKGLKEINEKTFEFPSGCWVYWSGKGQIFFNPKMEITLHERNGI